MRPPRGLRHHLDPRHLDHRQGTLMSSRLRLFRPISRGAARAVVVLFILSFLLSGAAYLFSVRAVQGEITSRASVVQLCQAGNEARGQQVTLWTHLIAISAPPPHQTPAQKRQRDTLIR